MVSAVCLSIFFKEAPYLYDTILFPEKRKFLMKIAFELCQSLEPYFMVTEMKKPMKTYFFNQACYV